MGSLSLPWRSGYTWWCWYWRWCRHRTWSWHTKRNEKWLFKETRKESKIETFIYKILPYIVLKGNKSNTSANKCNIKTFWRTARQEKTSCNTQLPRWRGQTWWCWYWRWCRHRTWSRQTKIKQLKTPIQRKIHSCDKIRGILNIQ